MWTCTNEFTNNQNNTVNICQVAALTLATAVIVTSTIIANSAFAVGTSKAEKNVGQCKLSHLIIPARDFIQLADENTLLINLECCSVLLFFDLIWYSSMVFNTNKA